MRFISLLLALLLSVGNVYAAPQRALLIDSSERALGTAANPIVVNGSSAPRLSETLVATTALYSNNTDVILIANQTLVTYNGNQYVAFWNSNSTLTTGKRSLPNGTWTLYTHASISVGSDVHNVPNFGVDKNGYIHIVAGLHADPLTGHYYKSNSAEDVSAFTSQGYMVNSTYESLVTYPFFMRHPTTNELYFTFRQGTSSNGDQHFYHYNATGGTWEIATGTATGGEMIDGTGSSPVQSPYLAGPPKWDSNGNLWFGWVWRADTELNSGHDFVLMKWNGTSFTDYAGNAMTLPVQYRQSDSTAQKINPAAAITQGTHVTVQTQMCLDKDDNIFFPVIKDDASGYMQLYVYRPTTSGGTTYSGVQITRSQLYASAVQARGVSCVADPYNSTVRVAMNVPELQESNGIQVFESKDLFSTWKDFYISNKYLSGWNMNYDYERRTYDNIISFLVLSPTNTTYPNVQDVLFDNFQNPNRGRLTVIDWDPTQPGRVGGLPREIVTEGIVKSRAALVTNGVISATRQSVLTGGVQAGPFQSEPTALVGQWKLNDNAANSTVTDATGNNNGTLKGAAGASINTSTLTTTGKINAAFAMVAANTNYVAFTNGAGITSYPFSVEAWFKPTSTAGDGGSIVSMANSGSTSGFLRVWMNSDVLTMTTGAVQNQTTAVTNVVDGNWHHIVWVCESSTMFRLYVDNNEVITNLVTTTFPSNTRFSIGALDRSSRTSYFNGSIDQVRLYNKVLTPYDVSALYNSGSGLETNPFGLSLQNTFVSSGNVGIGTDMNGAASKLSVIGGNVGIGTITAPTALYTVGTGYFTTGLNIGIGTASPTRLCIANNAVATCP